ncbi:MAG: hypothetical protein A3F72_16630 [Bacteroidetes bacterium RIFCSPLOWO2_12_FULL_35_15]|nr:MAG: hypothetical protein A3F72_16630 [Bacteroidetes bacterium RIFCSPLOWO2_12_FULL_35_15]
MCVTLLIEAECRYNTFGAVMPGRTWPTQTAADNTSAGTKPYRYGFNGKESDFEVKNIGGSQQDYGMRIYDPRLGKFLSVDPLFKDYSWNSTYAFAENDPINFIDLDGLEKAKRLNKVRRANLEGGGLVSLFGGLRGKYFKNLSFDNSKQKTSGETHKDESEFPFKDEPKDKPVLNNDKPEKPTKEETPPTPKDQYDLTLAGTGSPDVDDTKPIKSSIDQALNQLDPTTESLEKMTIIVTGKQSDKNNKTESSWKIARDNNLSKLQGELKSKYNVPVEIKYLNDNESNQSITIDGTIKKTP